MAQLNAFEQDCLGLINNLFLNSYMIKRAFFQACLYMDGQTPAVKKEIAEYYAYFMMTAFHQFTLGEMAENVKNRYICDYKNNKKLKNLFEKSKTLRGFFKEHILRQQQEMLPKFKTMIIDLENRGDTGIIGWAYQELDRVKNILPEVKLDTRITHRSIEDLRHKIKNSSHKKNSVTEAMFYLLFMMTVIYIAIDTYSNYKNNDIGMTGNVCMTIVITLLGHLAYAIGSSMCEVNRFRRVLSNALILQLEFVPPVEKEAKKGDKKEFSAPVSHAVPPVTKSAFSENYTLRVIPAPPVSLYENNENKKDRQPKRWQLPFWSQPRNDALTQETKQENTRTLPSEFGAAFNNISQENFGKLEGGSLGPESQLYGIWLDMDDPNAMDLHPRFKSGKMVAPDKKGIKRLVVDGVDGKYYEIKGSGAARVIGREFITVNQKTVIVFSQYDSFGLHGGHNETRRILAKVDNDLARLQEMNQNIRRPSLSLSA